MSSRDNIRRKTYERKAKQATKQSALRKQFWIAVASKQGLHIRF